jgi:N-acetylmuramoyl-L-alanine amidase
VVIHYTAMQSTVVALDRLTDPAAEVSAHYLIAEDGTVIALVPEELRAWHAGAGAWGGVIDVNSRSIGIELANPGTAPFAAPQMDALETLLDGILTRWSITPERVIGHSDMAPLRKADPGPRFDWRRLALSGLSVWPDPIATEPDAAYPAFLTSLGRFGYDTSLPVDIALRAFRLRFRPWATGSLDPLDLALAQDLARRFPVDQKAMGA